MLENTSNKNCKNVPKVTPKVVPKFELILRLAALEALWAAYFDIWCQQWRKSNPEGVENGAKKQAAACPQEMGLLGSGPIKPQPSRTVPPCRTPPSNHVSGRHAHLGERQSITCSSGFTVFWMKFTSVLSHSGGGSVVCYPTPVSPHDLRMVISPP